LSQATEEEDRKRSATAAAATAARAASRAALLLLAAEESDDDDDGSGLVPGSAAAPAGATEGLSFLRELGLDDKYARFEAAELGSLSAMLDERQATDEWLLKEGGLTKAAFKRYKKAAKLKIQRSPMMFRSTRLQAEL
jgi:hypothetical protein